MVGAAVSCAWAYAREGGGAGLRRHACWALLAGMATLWCSGLAVEMTRAILVGLASAVAGWGEAAALLAWESHLARKEVRERIGLLARSCIAAALIGVLLGCLESHGPALWCVLVALACLTSASAAFSAKTQADGAADNKDIRAERESQNACATGACKAGANARETEPTPARHTPGPSFQACVKELSRCWEPAAGLGLSLMSAILPWGSLIEGGVASAPAYWSFALGILVLAAVMLAIGAARKQRVDFEFAAHICVPILAAAVVGLRMLGDLESIGIGLAVFKGMASGATGAGFLIYGILAMTACEEARGTAGTKTFALGMAAALLIASLTLPLHLANQQSAALVAPLLSLAFLVAACCSSLAHIRQRREVQAPASLSIEEAVEVICTHYALSPRESQVMRELVIGRSAEGIARVLGISPNTVRSHICNIHGKLGISSRDELADLIVATQHASCDKRPAI